MNGVALPRVFLEIFTRGIHDYERSLRYSAIRGAMMILDAGVSTVTAAMRHFAAVRYGLLPDPQHIGTSCSDEIDNPKFHLTTDCLENTP